jgi:hypothetical protein
MATKSDADGTYEETILANGIVKKVYTSRSAAYQTRIDDGEAARPVDYIVCTRTTLASAKVVDTGIGHAADLSVADIDELIDAGQTVIREHDQQVMTHS